MTLNIPKKADLDAEKRVADEKAVAEEARAKRIRRTFAEKVLEGRIKNAFRYSDLCEDGQAPVVIDELILEFPELIEKCRKQLGEAGWKTKLRYAREEYEDQSFIIIFGIKNKY